MNFKFSLFATLFPTLCSDEAANISFLTEMRTHLHAKVQTIQQNELRSVAAMTPCIINVSSLSIRLLEIRYSFRKSYQKNAKPLLNIEFISIIPMTEVILLSRNSML